MTTIEHLQAAKSILETQCADAHKRYEQCKQNFRKYRDADCSKMRHAWNAWDEYEDLKDMIDVINTVLERAKKFDTTEINNEQI